MPWSLEDVDKHHKGLSDSQKKQWVAIANGVLKKCMDGGGDESACAASAIKQANGSVGKKDNSLSVLEFKINEKVKSRTEFIDGQSYIVLPATIMVEGVHSGSGGPVFYPKEELEKTAYLWNGVSVPVGHPVDENGNPAPIGKPEFLDKFVVGRFFNVEFKEDRLVGEIWLNELKVEGRFPNLKSRLQKNEDIEVSASLFTLYCDDVPGVWNNEKHLGTVYTYIPDHVAIMDGQKGACGFEDGCGIRNNTECPQAEVRKEFNHVKINNKETNMDRKEAIEKIVANSEFLKDMKLDNDPLKTLTDMPEPAFTIVQNAFNRIVGCECQEGKDDKKKTEQVNNEKKDDVKDPVKNPEPANSEKKEEPMTLEQYVNSAPSELKDVLNQSVRMHKGKKANLIKSLLNNKKNRFTEAQLNNKNMEELEILVDLAYEAPNMEGKNFDRGTLTVNERKNDGTGVPDCPEVSWKQ